MEYIDIDNRDEKFNKNEQGQEAGLYAILQSYTKPRTSDAGLDLNPIDQLINFCEYLSYITDANFLNSAIEYVKGQISLNNFDADFDTLKQQQLSKEKYSDEDLIKIKAINFSLKARFEIYKVCFNPPNFNLPFFYINYENRIIEHNLEFAKGVILRNNDIDYKEQIKTRPLEDAKRLYNSRIENLEDLEHKHNTDISSKTIKYLKSNKKRLIETKKSELEAPQPPTPPESNSSATKEYDQDETEKQVNQFAKNIPMQFTIEHFSKLKKKNKKGNVFLTDENFDKFIKCAFLNEKIIEKQKIDFERGESGTVIRVFYDYFDLACTKYSQKNSKEPFINMVFSCFDNWKITEIKSLFKPNKTKNIL